MKPAEGDKATFQIETVQGKTKNIDAYFAEERDRNDCVSALKATGLFGRMQVIVKVHGGGCMAQAQAIRLAIARAIREYDPTLEEPLREGGMLTREEVWPGRCSPSLPVLEALIPVSNTQQTRSIPQQARAPGAGSFVWCRVRPGLCGFAGALSEGCSAPVNRRGD